MTWRTDGRRPRCQHPENLQKAFLSGNTEEFTLDHGTGLVRVNTDLDYETKQEYSIKVQATDGKWSGELLYILYTFYVIIVIMFNVYII